MKKIIAALALLITLTTSVSWAEEIVDCFYEANASHPLCQK